MFTDINISSDLTNKFLQGCRDSDDNLDLSFSILVLQVLNDDSLVSNSLTIGLCMTELFL